jgi:hypothetical protein
VKDQRRGRKEGKMAIHSGRSILKLMGFSMSPMYQRYNSFMRNLRKLKEIKQHKRSKSFRKKKLYSIMKPKDSFPLLIKSFYL